MLKDFLQGRQCKRLLALLLAAALTGSLLGCSAADASQDTGNEDQAGQEDRLPQPADPLAPVKPDTDEKEPAEPDTVENSAGEEPTLSTKESEKDTGTPQDSGPYDYTAPVPESAAVDDSYFDDAVFIGDSRTEGFMLYAGPSGADYLTAVGLMVDTIFTQPYIKQGDKKVTVMDALAGMEFSKVYIMLGVNELGWVYSSIFQEYYGRIIDRIREINPDAIIYIESILPVSAEKSEKDSVYNNPRIDEFNQLLKDLAAEKEVYYLNVAEAVADETGCLPAEGTFDGVHLKPDYCKLWKEYLTTHTIAN